MGIILATTGLPLLSNGKHLIATTALAETVPMPDPKPDPEPGLDPAEIILNGPASEITYRDVTFTFSNPVYWLESANGDPVVISHSDYLPNGSSITSISPAGTVNAGGYKINGAARNPTHKPRSDTAEQGFDEALVLVPAGAMKTEYWDELNVDPANTSKPIQIRTGDAFTIVKAVRDPSVNDNTTSIISRYVPLTVMNKLPPRAGTWFRPAISTEVKEWPRIPIEEMDFTGGPSSPLRNLPIPNGLDAPSHYLQEIDSEGTHNQPIWIDTGESGRRMYVSGEGGNPGSAYSENTGNQRGRYVSSLFCDHSQNPSEQAAREQLAAILVQWGIDRDGAHQEGTYGGAGAGQYWGYHSVYYLASFMLQDEDMLERCQWHRSNGINQTHWITERMIGYPVSWDIGSVGGSNKNVGETYSREMLGLPEWTRGNWYSRKEMVKELPQELGSLKNSASSHFSAYRDTSYRVIIMEGLPICLLRNGPNGENGIDVVNHYKPVGPENIASAMLPYIDRSITFQPAIGRAGHHGLSRRLYDLWRDEVPQPRWTGQPDIFAHHDLPVFSVEVPGEIDFKASEIDFSTKAIKRREVSYSQDGVQFSAPVTVSNLDSIPSLRLGTDYWCRWRQVNEDDELSAWSPTWEQNLATGKADPKYHEPRGKVRTLGAASGQLTNTIPPALMWKPYPAHPMPYFEPAEDMEGVIEIHSGIGLWEGGSGDLTPAYQWQRNDGSGWHDIPDETAQSYARHAEDGGHRLRCMVSVNGSSPVASNEIEVPETVAPPSGIIVETDFDGYFPFSYPGIWSQMQLENGVDGSQNSNIEVEHHPYLAFDDGFTAGAVNIRKLGSRPTLSVVLTDSAMAGTYKYEIDVGSGFFPSSHEKTASAGVRTRLYDSTDTVIAEHMIAAEQLTPEGYLERQTGEFTIEGGEIRMEIHIPTSIGLHGGVLGGPVISRLKVKLKDVQSEPDPSGAEILLGGSKTASASAAYQHNVTERIDLSDLALKKGDMVLVGVAGKQPMLNSRFEPTGGILDGQKYTDLIARNQDKFPGYHVAYKFMGDTPDSEVIIQKDINRAQVALVQVIRGIDPNDPIDGAAVSAHGTGGGMPAAPAYTTENANCLRVVFAAIEDNDLTAEVTSPEGWEGLVTRGHTSQKGGTAMFVFKEADEIGSDNPDAFGGTNPDKAWRAFHFALKGAEGEPVA